MMATEDSIKLSTQSHILLYDGVFVIDTPCIALGGSMIFSVFNFLNMGTSKTSYSKRLQTLECQFTWNLERNDKLNIFNILQSLEVKIQHASYPNGPSLYNVKAYLLHQLKRSNEALLCLKLAEEQVRIEEQASADHHILTIYGNYAWIYYHLNNFQQVDFYLEKIQEIYRMSSDTACSADTYAERGWSLLLVGIRNGYQAGTFFEKALEIRPEGDHYFAGLAYSTYAHAIYTEDVDVRNEAIGLLGQLVTKDPQNWEAKALLAKMLQDSNSKKNLGKARKVTEDNFQGCSNPEALRIIAGLYRITPPTKSLDLLERAKSLAPHYHQLIQETGHVHRHQVYRLRDAERSHAIAEASKFYTAAIELMPWNASARLDLAEMYAQEYKTDLEGVIYSMINAEVDSLDEACKQRFYLQYGIYFLYKVHCASTGIEILKKGFQIRPESKRGVKCKKNLAYYILLDRTKEEEIDGFIGELEDRRSDLPTITNEA